MASLLLRIAGHRVIISGGRRLSRQQSRQILAIAKATKFHSTDESVALVGVAPFEMREFRALQGALGEQRGDLAPDGSGSRRLNASGVLRRLRLGRRGRKEALECRAFRGIAVCWQHELDRQVEQRTEPSDDILAGHVLATAELNV